MPLQRGNLGVGDRYFFFTTAPSEPTERLAFLRFAFPCSLPPHSGNSLDRVCFDFEKIIYINDRLIDTGALVSLSFWSGGKREGRGGGGTGGGELGDDRRNAEVLSFPEGWGEGRGSLYII